MVIRQSLARAWLTDLPRVVRLLQVGTAFNWLGYGLILPFEIIYLHQLRGFSTATSGLVLAAILGAGAVATPPSGAMLDRFRPKSILSTKTSSFSYSRESSSSRWRGGSHSSLVCTRA